MDLAVVEPSGSGGIIAIFLGDGKGGFKLSAKYSAAAGSGRIAVADFNGDGHLDVAVTNPPFTGAGWYGFVKAASVGIIRLAMVEQEAGMVALEKLGSPDRESRSQDYDGRRLIRVDGGFLILNYMKYRDHDYNAADRMRRLRARRKGQSCADVRRNDVTVQPNVTHSREQIAETDKIKNNNPVSKTCKKHPDSGLTQWGTCWACYVEKNTPAG